MVDKNARGKLIAGRTALVLDQPFWASLALKLDPVETNEIDTAVVDGQHLFYNPHYVNSLTHSAILGLLAEEVAHCALGHIWRRGGRDPLRWNIACDYAIASELKEAGFDIGDMSYEPAYTGRSAEWIYDRLPGDPNQQDQSRQKGRGQGQGQGCGQKNLSQGQGGQQGQQGQKGRKGQGQGQKGQRGQKGYGRVDVCDPAPETSEAAWQQAVVQAAVAAKGRGRLPASAERLIQTATATRIDWRSFLLRWVQEIARGDYSWTLPNRRYIGRGLYLPALRNYELGPIAVAIDTSGSVDEVFLNQFADALLAVIDQCQPQRVVVLYADARVQRVETFEPGDPITFRPHGGGGTDFRPVFQHLATLSEPVVGLIYLTDLDGTFPSAAPEYPVLWAISGTKTIYTPPFGETVCIM